MVSVSAGVTSAARRLFERPGRGAPAHTSRVDARYDSLFGWWTGVFLAGMYLPIFELVGKIK